jgi:hypothetical protein
VRIGGAVLSIEFSSAEKNRIAIALRDSSSRAHQVLSKTALHVHDQEFWRAAQKNFNVQGFRPGSHAAREHVLRRALNSVKNRDGSEVKPLWTLYRRCVTHYVVHELTTLNTILQNEDLIDDSRSLTAGVFASINRAMPLYDVTADQVREFYELWGFERISSLDEIILDETVSATVAKRLIVREVHALSSTLGEEIRAIRAEMAGALKVSREARGDAALLERIVDLEQRIKATEAASDRASKLVDVIAKLDSKVESLQTKLDSPSRQNLDEQAACEKSIQALRSRVESLVGSVNKHEKRLSEISSADRSPGNKKRANLPEESWDSVLSRVRANCARAGYEISSALAARVLLEMIRHTRIAVSPRESLVLGAISCDESVDIKVWTASPLWLDASDWREAVSFLSDFDAPTRVCILLDFDVALQEAYLMPTIRTWLASVPRSCMHRLILVPADASLEAVSPRVLEFGVLIGGSTDFLTAIDRATRATADEFSKRLSNIAGTDLLSFEEAIQRNREDEIRRLVENMDAELPAQIATRFISLQSGLQKYVSAADAAHMASECTLLPWYRRVRGDGASRLLAGTLMSIYGSR